MISTVLDYTHDYLTTHPIPDTTLIEVGCDSIPGEGDVVIANFRWHGYGLEIALREKLPSPVYAPEVTGIKIACRFIELAKYFIRKHSYEKDKRYAN